MAITTIEKVGAFTNDVATQINDNFTSLSGSTAGGTLTSGHLLVGDGSNVATDTAITGDVTISNAGVTAIKASATRAQALLRIIERLSRRYRVRVASNRALNQS